MCKISTIIGHFLAWFPIVLTAYVYLYFRIFTDTDFGLAAIVLNQYVAPITVGAAAAVVCLVINLLKILCSKTHEAKWYDVVGTCLQALLILTFCIGFGLVMESARLGE